MERTGLWAWYVSALFYRRTYGPLAHALDDQLFTWLGALDGLRCADVGCGPGIVTRKLVERGADHVWAIDANPAMLRQVPQSPRISTALGRAEDGVIRRLADEHGGFDVVLFKRSLYQPRPLADQVLEDAWDALRPGGRVCVVHGEKSLRLYAFGEPARIRRHTPYHLFNRTVSRIGELAGGENYTTWSRDELVEMMSGVAGAEHVSALDTPDRSFNLVAMTRPAAR